MARIGQSEFGFWDKIKYLLSDPNDFFEKIKSDSIKNALLMYAIVGVFMTAVSFIGFLIMTTQMSRFEGGFGSLMIIITIASYIIGIIVTFLYSLLIHAIVIAFKGAGKYSDSYNVFTYSMIPFMLLVMVPMVGFLSIIYSYVLMIIGISKIHMISKMKAALACLLPGIVIIGLFIIISDMPIYN